MSTEDEPERAAIRKALESVEPLGAAERARAVAAGRCLAAQTAGPPERVGEHFETFRRGRVMPTLINASEKTLNAVERAASYVPTSEEMKEEHDELEIYLLLRENNARKSSPHENRARLVALWERAFREAALTEERLAPLRRAAGYRILREHARLARLVIPDEPLAGGIEVAGVDPWRTPKAFTGHRTPLDDARAWPVLQFLSENALALLPTAETAELHAELANRIAFALGIDVGAPGLAAFVDPAQIVSVWPSPLECMAWEQALVQAAIDASVRSGTSIASKKLRDTYGLQPHEAVCLARIAARQIREFSRFEIEEERALMRIRLDDFIERCQKVLNLKSEMAALKQLALVVGLTRADPEDQLSDFLAVVKRVSAESRPALDVKARALPLDSSNSLETREAV